MRNLNYFTKSLKYGSDKYMITNRLYRELIAETNLIGDYNKARRYVYSAITNCKDEVKEVTNFNRKKVDIEI